MMNLHFTRGSVASSPAKLQVAELRKIENESGTLPEDYRRFVLSKNGGEPVFTYFRVPDVEDWLTIQYLLGLEPPSLNNNMDSPCRNSVSECYHRHSFLSNQMLPVAEDINECSCVVVMNLTGKRKHKIDVILCGEIQEDKLIYGENRYEVSDSFEEFCSLLCGSYLGQAQGEICDIYARGFALEIILHNFSHAVSLPIYVYNESVLNLIVELTARNIEEAVESLRSQHNLVVDITATGWHIYQDPNDKSSTPVVIQ